ncbi:6,7-dimethyl-8-ribityllumazine synthase [Fulvivirgaceae bacterium PWU4]|uniref:6,7-dimethyl-8-ribityllumazine synthase n=1 Tax=Chryseosolibacter histidini TaxID=2782349 RepID=A0AAP2GM33_9BACT|nr:6,7-dimethyl-8-ribityllumazine synthase [Chryseosolibacter histidini]MBT1696503.1 6,7-dimethyl-8-ribityllumazine synthase [Chryseosolibacter histidini]
MAGPLTSGKVKSKIDLSKKKFAIVVAEWNEEITEALYEGAVAGLTGNGVKKSNIVRKNVPGSFELSLGGLWMAEEKKIDAVICLGCVIQGDTPHFDYICQAVAYGVTEAGLKTRKPVIFGVLTTLNKQQALDRAGGKLGNKGEEAAITAIKMLDF